MSGSASSKYTNGIAHVHLEDQPPPGMASKPAGHARNVMTVDGLSEVSLSREQLSSRRGRVQRLEHQASLRPHSLFVWPTGIGKWRPSALLKLVSLPAPLCRMSSE